jgi:hypothetical protein
MDLVNDDVFKKVGPDATATFDNSASNPTEHASSEALSAATVGDDDEDELDEDVDDVDAEEEEDDEEDEEEDVEDEAEANE